MSIWKKIVSAISAPFNFALSKLRGIDIKKAQKAGLMLNGFLNFALPYADWFAKAITPDNPLDDVIVQALIKVNTTIPAILASADAVRHSLKADVAGEALRIRLEREIAKGNKIQLGDIVIETLLDLARIDPIIFREAATSAYAVWAVGAGKKKID